MQQVIRCPNCGSPNYSDQKFCGACGAGLITGCPNCGASIDPGAKFCGSCGAQLSGGMPQQQPPQQQAGWGQQPPPQQPGWGQQPPPQQPGWGQQPPPQQPGWGQQAGGMPQQQQGWGQPSMRRSTSSSTSTFLIVVLVVLLASLGTFGYFAFFSDSPPWSGISGGTGGTIEVTSGPFVTVADNTSSEVAIEWETDELCKGQIEYGETTEYGSESTTESSFVKSHSISLPDLDPGTSYNYRLLMTDKKGNTTTSANKTFTSPQT
jgi:hypothetical protein